MTELRLKIGRLGRIIEIALFVVAVPVIVGVLYVLARFLRWGLDRNYHLFSK
jgi:hypothetical protein